MILRDVDNIKVGSTSVNKVYQGNYKVYDKNKIALEGYCKQNTTTGKNLIDDNEAISQTINGLTFTVNEDKSITINGTATANTNYILARNITLNPGTYTLSGCPAGGNVSSTYYLGLAVLGVETPFVDIGNNHTRTITSTYQSNLTYRIFIFSGAVINNLTFYPMFQEGSIATDYEPYTGGQPSPNPNYPQEIEVMEGKQVVNVSSENKFKPTLSIDGYNINQTHCTVTLNGDIFNFTAEASDIYFGHAVSRGLIHSNVHGYLMEIPSTGTIYVKCSNSNFDKQYVSFFDESKTSLGYYSVGINGVSIPSNAKYCCVRIGINNPTIGQTYSTTIMVSTVNTDYVPYKSQDFEVDLKSKNLIDISTLDVGYVGGLGNILTNDTTNGVMHSEFIEVEPNTTYRFKIFETSSNYPNWFGVGLYSSNDENTFIERQTMTNTSQNYIQITTTSTTNYIRVSGRNLAEATKIMLYEGTEETDYEPYYNYKLAGIGDYKDNFYTKEGKWYVKSLIGKVVLDGSENISGYAATSLSGSYQATFEITTKATSTEKIVLSDYFTSALISDRTTKTNICYTYTDGLLRIATNLATTMADFKSWLSIHNVVVYYALATPTEEEITSPTLIQQLNRLYQAM